MWQIEMAYYGSPTLKRLLEEGWEPFTVTCPGNPEFALIWLRKAVKNGS